MMNSKTKLQIIEFLKTQKKFLKKNDLNSVYNNLIGKKVCTTNQLTEFLFDNNLNPLDYFVDEIPNSFAFNMNLLSTDLKINSNITTIGNYAFYKSGIETLYIPSSVKEIGIAAFCGCDSLEKVFIDGCPELREDVFIWNIILEDFKMNCSEEQFNKINPKQLDEYKYDCGLDIEFLK